MKFIKILLIFVVFVFPSVMQAEHIQSDSYRYTYNLDEESSDIYDPYEKFNRKVFNFNSALDRMILRPIAVFYDKTTNNYVKARVGSFTDNINMPLTIVNYGLQAKFNDTMRSFWRFAINSTLGIGGLFDIASKFGLNDTRQTFGSTLAHYGVPPGPYIVLPFFGGTGARDITDSLYTNNALNPLKYSFHKDFKLVFNATKLVHDRAMMLPFTNHITQNSTDPYIAIRSATYQNRESKVEYPVGFKYPQAPNN